MSYQRRLARQIAKSRVGGEQNSAEYWESGPGKDMPDAPGTTYEGQPGDLATRLMMHAAGTEGGTPGGMPSALTHPSIPGQPGLGSVNPHFATGAAMGGKAPKGRKPGSHTMWEDQLPEGISGKGLGFRHHALQARQFAQKEAPGFFARLGHASGIMNDLRSPAGWRLIGEFGQHGFEAKGGLSDPKRLEVARELRARGMAQ